MNAKAKWLVLCLAAAALLHTGCTVTKYESATGEKFSRYAVGNRTSVGEMSVVADTAGVRTFQLKGYSNDQAEVAGAVTEAAVRAALAK